MAISAGTYDEELTIGQRASGAFSADLYCRCPDMVRITRPGGTGTPTTSVWL